MIQNDASCESAGFQTRYNKQECSSIKRFTQNIREQKIRRKQLRQKKRMAKKFKIIDEVMIVHTSESI